MTNQVQHTLRSIIDISKNNSRFILICNNITNIIESLQSRCIIFKFYSLTYNDILKKIKFILKNENIKYKNNAIKLLINNCNGDLRNCINNLQSVYSLIKILDKDTITIENVKKIINIPHNNIVKDIFDNLKEKNFDKIIENILKLHNLGYSLIDIIETFNEICFEYKMEEEKKIKYQKIICNKYQIRIANGYTNYLQLLGLVSELIKI